MRRPANTLDTPRLLLINQQRAWTSTQSMVDIAPSGEAIYTVRLWGDFSQRLRLQDFPFDAHTFQIELVAFQPSGEDVVLVQDPEFRSFFADELSVADWNVLGWRAEPREVGVSQVTRPGFVLEFDAERLHFHYLIKFIVPQSMTGTITHNPNGTS